jgi:RHS repeat-associated protein
MTGQTAKTMRFPLPGGGTAELNGAAGGTKRILHSDWLGSVRLSTTYTGQTVANDTSYAPFAEAYDNSSSVDFNFTGMSQDTVTGLYDFPYREYSTVGRWISPDPAGLGAVDPTNPQTWNRYAYVAGNPLSFIDPTGLQQGVTLINGQCANAQNPAICQGGYEMSMGGGMWFTIGWDEFEGVLQFVGENGEYGWSIVQPPMQNAGSICYVYVQLCGVVPPQMPQPSPDNYGKNLNCKQAAGMARNQAENSFGPSASDILKTPDIIEAAIAGAIGGLSPLVKGLGIGAVASAGAETAGVGLAAAGIYNYASWMKQNAPAFEAQQDAIYNGAVQQCDAQYPVSAVALPATAP